MRVLLSGWIQLGQYQFLTGTHSHGQGHDTTFAQIVTEKLGVDITASRNRLRRLGELPGMGTHGSRSLLLGGTAIS